jgi:hypothetical protein
MMTKPNQKWRFISILRICQGHDHPLKPENEALKPEDFPVHTQQKKIVKTDGKTIAEARNQKTAEDVAERLNAEEDRRGEDRWSA